MDTQTAMLLAGAAIAVVQGALAFQVTMLFLLTDKPAFAIRSGAASFALMAAITFGPFLAEELAAWI